MCNSAIPHCSAGWTVQQEPLDKGSKGCLDCYTTGKLFSLNRWQALTKVSKDIRGLIDPLCLQMLPDNPCYQHQLKRMCRLLLTKLPKHWERAKYNYTDKADPVLQNLGLKPVTLTDEYFIMRYPGSLLYSDFFIDFAVFFNIGYVSFAFSQLHFWGHT